MQNYSNLSTVINFHCRRNWKPVRSDRERGRRSFAPICIYRGRQFFGSAALIAMPMPYRNRTVRDDSKYDICSCVLRVNWLLGTTLFHGPFGLHAITALFRYHDIVLVL